MNSLLLPAPAKLNLFLRVTGRRADGYHTLQTLFQLLDHGDTLQFEPTAGSWELPFTCSESALGTSDNLVLRAARLLQDRLREANAEPRGCRIHLQKALPAGGGLGGGSSDAATTLVALNHLWDLDMPLDSLAALGLQLGADVPVFVRGRSAWAEGVGEQLEALDLPEDWFVVLTPPVHVATARVFGHPDLTRHSAPLRIRAFPFSGAKNDCESVTCMLYPEVKSTLEWLGAYAPDARMSGTGSSVFARFDSREQAVSVLARKPAGLQGFVARGTNLSPLHRALQDARPATESGY
ncbi:MAG TPA: 4-(cytidine 5'-diphospho)-2-C-methyl-D-erythritol kinase [Pseudomonadales bacterium]